jgi:three-Cys-motif partner protein
MKDKTFKTHYIDAYAGAGNHIIKNSGDVIHGSPRIVIEDIELGFDNYHLIEKDKSKYDQLCQIFKDRKNVRIYNEDCNDVLPSLFASIKYENYERAFCFLDPYNFSIKWEHVVQAANAKTIELLINFMIYDANRNYLRTDFSNMTSNQKEKMNIIWGDDSWEKSLFVEKDTLFGDVLKSKTQNRMVTDSYIERLKEVAGFKYVPRPSSMKTTKNSDIYYLIFASHNEAAGKIMSYVMQNYEKIDK